MNSTPSPPPLRLELLGVPRLRGPVGESLSGRKELALLAYVARRAPRPMPRDQLADLFWGERGELRARQSLRQAMVTLRRAVGEGLMVTPDEVRLAAGTLDVDVLDFEDALRAGRLAHAVGLWHGEFLARMEDAGGDSYRVWLEAEREILRQRFAAALEWLAADAGENGNWAEAAGWAERWVEACPLEERAHAALLAALVRTGRGGEARARYATFAERVRRDLGVEPSSELTRLIPAAPAPWREVRPHLPAPGSVALFSPSLTGRDGALVDLAAAWRTVRAQGSALVVVEGEEGIGKTRLCEEFLRTLASTAEPVLVLRMRMDAEHGAEADPPHHRELHALLSPLATAPGLSGASDAALAALGRWVPAIRERFPRLPAPAADDQELHTALRDVLDAVAAEVPVVLLIDDFPYAEPLTRRTLLALARESPAAVLLLLTGRVEDLQRVGASAIAEIPAARRLILQPLSAVEVEALLGSMLELRSDVRRTLAARLHEATEGNPFFLVEMLAALADEGRLTLDAAGVWCLAGSERAPLPIPAGVQDAVVQRISRLSAPACTVLEAAAIQGRAFEVHAIEDAAALSHEQYLEALYELVTRRVLRRQHVGSGFEFTHDLVRRIVLERLPATRGESLRSPGGRAHEAAPRGSGPTGSGESDIGPARTGPLPLLRRHRSAVAALTAALLLVAGGLVGKWSAPAPVSGTTIAVLPFAVQGGDAYDYLQEGMVDLLSTRLDGAGELRAVDPRALMAYMRRTSLQDLDPAVARQAAEHFGAGLYVLGSVTEAGDRLQLSAAMYDATGEVQATAHSATAGESQFLELVDQLAMQLLADRYRTPAEALSGTAARTTSSFPALKAYLEGERDLRAGAFHSAVQAFERATALDTAFALAYYRLSVASEWAPRPDYELAAIDAAERHSHRLSDRSRLLVQALLAWRRGEASRAEGIYRRILALYPDEVEAWFQLAEVLFHSNPLRGRSITESREAWERVLAYEPDNAFALVHLARIATVEEKTDDLDGYLQRLRSIVPDEDRRVLEVAALSALARRDRAAEDSLLATMQRSSHADFIPFLHIATYSRNLEGAERLLAAATTPTLPPERWAWGPLHRAFLALGQGRWRGAQGEFAALARHDPGSALLHRAFLASVPFTQLSPAEALRLREEVRARHGEPPGLVPADVLGWKEEMRARYGESPGILVYDTYPAPHVGEYLLGSLSLLAGDSAGALRHIAALERRGRKSSEEAALAGDLALGLRARLAWGQGRTADALALLEQARMQATRETSSQSPFLARAAERYLRAELLRELGRYQEALGWYGSLGELSPFEAAFLAPASLRRAEIHERLGERKMAILHYRRFLELWQDADPELEPLVREMAGRVGRLERDGRRARYAPPTRDPQPLRSRRTGE